MKPITLYTANCRGDASNSFYPNKRVIVSAEDLEDAVQYDHVFAEYRNYHRAVADYVCSDCQAYDCDNDHSDQETDWKTAADVEAAFPGVPFYVVYSRHHMKWKEKRGPRPRFHVFFPIDPMADEGAYSQMKKSVYALFPYFDPKALDTARFFFGLKNPVVEMHGGADDESE